ncbi:PaaI family thioesterase [Geodermatophilus sp. YIM 151500]|uniref:PaaI family thioesterase n=1 Tax=Geodermatophilus sp. YIM 151500 TaxID=2984531 RepID=UPI0021E37C3F|nr:PaaI family thioesterase [Geodermatophilus sp. YIM 151500]MCV2490346.1 PaaI family thioesterase [Geodermatophilus sp. YIM 151500]
MEHDAGAPFDPELMAAVGGLGSALRELVDAAVRTTVGAAELRAATDAVRAVSGRLATAQRPPTQLPALDDVRAFRRVYNPVSGVGSALAPPLVLRRAEGGVLGDVSLGSAYEGPPGYVHGGVSALLMDQLLGAATISAGLWGMTARLELDYRRPVPLRTPLRLTARVVEDAGRRSVVTGTVALADEPGRPLVEGRGVFVMPRPELQEAYFGAVTDASGRPSPPGRPTDATALRDEQGPEAPPWER